MPLHSERIRQGRLCVFYHWLRLKRAERRIWQDFHVLRAKHRVKYKNTCYQQWQTFFVSQGTSRETLVREFRTNAEARMRGRIFDRLKDLVLLSSRMKSLYRRNRYRHVARILRVLLSIIRTRSCLEQAVIQCVDSRHRQRALFAWGLVFRRRLFAVKVISRLYSDVITSWNNQKLFQRIQSVKQKTIISCWRANTYWNNYFIRLQSQSCAKRAIQDMRLLYQAIHHDRKRIMSESLSQIIRRFHASRIHLFFRLWFIRSLQSVSLSHRACIKRVLLAWSARSSRKLSLKNRYSTTRLRVHSHNMRLVFRSLVHLFGCYQRLRNLIETNRAHYLLLLLSQSVDRSRIFARRSTVLSARLNQRHLSFLFRSWVLGANIERLHGNSIRKNLHAVIQVFQYTVSMRIRKRILLFRAVRFRSTYLLRVVSIAWLKFAFDRRMTVLDAYARVGQSHAMRRTWTSWWNARPELRDQKRKISQAISDRSKECLCKAFQEFLVYVKDRSREGSRLIVPSRQLRIVRECHWFTRWRDRKERLRQSRLDCELRSTMLIAKRLKTVFCKWIRETRILKAMNKRGERLLISQSIKRWLKVTRQEKRVCKSVFRGMRLKFFLAWIVGVERGLGLQKRFASVVERRLRKLLSGWRNSVSELQQFSEVKKSYMRSIERRTVTGWRMVILKMRIERLAVQRLRYDKKGRVLRQMSIEASKIFLERVEETRIYRERMLRETMGCWYKLGRSKIRYDLRLLGKSFLGWRSWLSERSVTSRSTTPGLEIAQVSHCAVAGTQQVTIDEVLLRLLRIKQKISIMGSVD